MRVLFEISISYWKKHKRQLLQLLLVLILSMAGLVSACFFGRSGIISQLNWWLNARGNFDISVYYPDSEVSDYLNNDDRFSEKSRIIRIGYAEFGQYGRIDIGYFENELSKDMFHLELADGRYPEAENEICVDELTLKELGYSARINQEIQLDIFDNKDGSIKNSKYKIVGIVRVKVQGQFQIGYTRQNYDRYGNEYYPPLIYMSCAEGEKLATKDADYIFLGNVKYTKYFDDYSMLYELNTKFESIACSDTGLNFSRSQVIAAITMRDNASLRDSIGYLANEKYIGGELMQKDFYNGVLIPLFFALFVLMTIFSVYSVLCMTLAERNKEIGTLRSIGMNMKQLTGMLLIEMLVFLFIGLAVGFLLGVVIYVLTVLVGGHCFNQPVEWAFTLDDFWGKYISMVTHNPYFFPMLVIILVVCMVYFFYIGTNLKGDAVSTLSNKQYRKKKYKSIGKSLTGRFHTALVVIIIFIIVAVSYSYFSCRKLAEENAMETQEIVDGIGTDNYDYVATLDVSSTILGYNQLLHQSGISREQYEQISSDANVEAVVGYIANLSPKLILTEDDSRNTVLANGNNRYQSKDFYTEEENAHFQKVDDRDWYYKGYLENEMLYQLPMLGFPDSNLHIFDKYILKGSINTDKLRTGEEVILVVNDLKLADTFSIGETLNLTDVVFEKRIDEDENIPMGITEAWMEVTEYIDGAEFYAVGSRYDFDVSVGAIVFVDDDLKELIWKIYPIPDSGMRVITSMEAFNQIGLPDEKITDLYVKLSESADITEFEGIWYSIVTNAYKMNNYNITELKKNVKDSENASMLMFYALFIVFTIVGSICIYNIVKVMILNAIGKIRILERIGASKRMISAVFMKRLAMYPIIAGFLSCIICKGYMLLVDIAEAKKDLNGQVVVDGKETKTWYNLLPCINLSDYHPFAFIVIFSIIILILTECFTYVGVRRMKYVER
ncbi:MAG: FtsX-like permease family protein [Wujia sp.]